jgi:hypothetical protein
MVLVCNFFLLAAKNQSEYFDMIVALEVDFCVFWLFLAGDKHKVAIFYLIPETKSCHPLNNLIFMQEKVFPNLPAV